MLKEAIPARQLMSTKEEYPRHFCMVATEKPTMMSSVPSRKCTEKYSFRIISMNNLCEKMLCDVI